MRLAKSLQDIKVGDYVLNYDRQFIRGIIIIGEVLEIQGYMDSYLMTHLRQITRNWPDSELEDDEEPISVQWNSGNEDTYVLDNDELLHTILIHSI